MIFNKLVKTVYLKSRYELMALLENIQPAKGNLFEGSSLSSDVANLYEEKIDTYFPRIPFSEERLAVFSHIVSNAGIVMPDLQNAINANNRVQAWFVMRYAQTDKNNDGHTTIKRCFYEAEVFGLFDNPNAVDESEIKSVIDFLNSNYKNDVTHWQHMLGSENDNLHPLCIYQQLKLMAHKIERRVVTGCLTKNIFVPFIKIYSSEALRLEF